MTWLVNLLSSSAVNAVGGFFLRWYETYQKGKDSEEAKRAELARTAMQNDIEEARLNNALLVAEQGNWFTRSVRPALGWIIVIFVGKLLLWDKAFGQWTNGTTDALDTNLWWIVQTIIIAYMGGRTAEKVADKIAGALRR